MLLIEWWLFMNGKDKDRILDSVDKEVGRVRLNVPAQLFRLMLIKLKVDARNYDLLIRSYLERTTPNPHPVALASDRGNLNKALLANIISWKTFMRGMEMLGVTGMKVTLHVKQPTGRWVSVESDEITLRNASIPIQDQLPLDLDNTEIDED